MLCHLSISWAGRDHCEGPTHHMISPDSEKTERPLLHQELNRICACSRPPPARPGSVASSERRTIDLGECNAQGTGARATGAHQRCRDACRTEPHGRIHPEVGHTVCHLCGGQARLSPRAMREYRDELPLLYVSPDRRWTSAFTLNAATTNSASPLFSYLSLLSLALYTTCR